MPAFTFTMATGCEYGAGFVDILTLRGGAPGAAYSYELTGQKGTSYTGGVVAADLPLRLAPLVPDSYTLLVNYLNPDNSGSGSSRDFESDCSGTGGQPGALVLDRLGHTDETATLGDGTATIQASGGTAPLTAELLELSLSQPATGGQPNTFPNLPPARYTLRITDSSTPPQTVGGQVDVLAYMAPHAGCQDEYADNYDPLATTGGYASCTYTPRWRSAWQPLAVRVAAQAGQLTGFTAATLRIGFRPGHPLAADRPLGPPLALRATVGPDGYATFVLGPYLRSALGAPDGAGGYRYDLNSPTAYDADLYVGYELRRAGTGELLEHGYALNSAVPDALLHTGPGAALTPFLNLFPVWPGFDFPVPTGAITPGGVHGYLEQQPFQDDQILLPCPPNPLPVRWLAPGGGYGHWVFQGRPVLGDSVGEGQAYREASSGQQRYSDAGDSYQTFKASSGVFKGDSLLAGLRTLWRSPQAWVQLELGGEWLPIVLPRGDRDVATMGIRRQELVLNFSLAAPEWAQGQ